MNLGTALVKILGRERAWRIGRKLYILARGDVPNIISENGEQSLIRSALAAHSAMHAPNPFVAFDVGANVGDWSVVALAEAANVDKIIDLHAFEPVPETFDTLTKRLAPFGGVTQVALALSNTAGEAKMQVIGANEGTNTLNAGDSGGQSISVPLDTATAYADRAGINTIHLLKIDAEGHDLEVLRGALGLLHQKRIWIAQFEYNHRWLFAHNSMYGLFQLAHQVGYQVARVTPDGLEFYAKWNAELDRFFESNFSLVRPDLLSHLPHCRGDFGSSNVFVENSRHVPSQVRASNTH